MNEEYLKIPREVDPACRLLDNLDTTIWRYMDYPKFEWLLRNSALYLCRADRLQDRFEGGYSRQQLFDRDTWLESRGYSKVIEAERQRQIEYRNRTYTSCWCVGDCDLDLMWKAYIRNPPGVAIRSTVRRLQQVCDTAVDLRPLDISLVRYIDHAAGESMNYPGMPEVLFCKDLHFPLDNEIRIVYLPISMGPPTPDHVLLSVSLAHLIVSVVLAPHAPDACVRGTREALDRLRLKAVPVEFSRDDRDLIA